ERVSGQPYGDYVQENVLKPLGMVRTTVSFPLTEQQAAAETKGYTYADGRLQRTPFFLGQPAETPAGGLLSTASDMTRYMNMHLADGQYVTADGTEGRVLGAGTARVMQTT